jgi:putative exosortase-associated protein (TIGR04073 family)
MRRNEILRTSLMGGYACMRMKIFLTVALIAGFAAASWADIQDPPANGHGPTRKLGRGLSNVVFGWSEVYPTVAKVNQDEGNFAAAGYGVVRGVGRGFARFGVGLYEVLLFPFPVNRGTYMPILPSDVHYIYAGYSEFAPELGNESKYRYVRYY